MIRAENIPRVVPRVVETSVVRLYFCHDWAMAEPDSHPEQQASHFNLDILSIRR
jgi:hypothetical protein